MFTVPSPSLTGASRELILALSVALGRHSATVCSSEDIIYGKSQQTGGSPGEVRGLEHVTLEDRLRELGLFGCTRDLIALFHLGGYRGDRARLSLKMPGGRTRANVHNLLQGKLWPYRREKKFSQRGESGSGRGQRGDGTFVLKDT